MQRSKTSATQPRPGTYTHPLGKIEVLPHAIHTLVLQTTSECYGVLGIAAPRLRNGQAVLLSPSHVDQGVRANVVDNQLIIDIYVALEYGLRISEIAHNIMSSVKFSVEKQLGIPVAQVNINVQGLLHGPASQDRQEKIKR
jgi:uncharacterized alkaline shock family protein YloU